MTVNSTPSEKANALYEAVADPNPMITNDPHRFSVHFQGWDTSAETIRLKPDDYPYMRGVLMDHAIDMGDLEEL